jgi:IS5 family transposase
MKRGARDHPIGIRDKLRNERISKKRSKGERPFAVIKNVFGAGIVKVTEIPRARVKNMFSAFRTCEAGAITPLQRSGVFCYNIYRLRTIEKQST